MLARVGLANNINRASGGAVIAPWQIDELDETWLDVFRVLGDELPTMRDAYQRIKKVKDSWLASHPTYGKH
jgi:hypothetical protein